MLAGQLAKKYHIDLVSIHPGLVLGTVYYPNASAVSMQVMKVGPFQHPGHATMLGISSAKSCTLAELSPGPDRPCQQQSG